MDEKKILNEIKKYLKKHIKKDVNMNTSIKDLGFDSLDLMDLVISVEDKYKVQIPDEELLQIKTIENLVKILKKLKE